jgi:hypothetical protein
MSQPNPALNESPRRELPETGWLEELAAALERAAQLAATNGISGDTFKRAAWDAYLNARPGLRQELEDKQLKAQLRKLRKRGLIASA